MGKVKTLGKTGADGRLYYRYGIGLKFLFVQQNGEESVVEIVDCYFYRGSKTVYYFGTKNGNAFAQPFSESRLTYLLKNQCKQILDRGQPREFPLLNAEVKRYYDKFILPRVLARREAESLLKTTEYYSISSAIRGLNIDKIFAEERGTDVTELNAQISGLEARRAEILNKNRISPDLFKYDCSCAVCGSTGIIESYDGKRSYALPCSCADKRIKHIKAYNAELRRGV